MKNNLQKILLIILGLMIAILVCLGIGKMLYQENNVVDNNIIEDNNDIDEDIEDVETNDNNNNKKDEKTHEAELISKIGHSELSDDFAYIEDEEYNAIIFVKYNKDLQKYEKINKYYCKESRCYIDGYFENSNCTLIYDTNMVIYNYEKGVLFETDDFKNVGYISRDHDGRYFVLKNKDGKVGLIDTDGNVIVDYKYEEIGKYNEHFDAISEASFSLDKDFIRYKDNNKYGILRLSDGKVLLNANYDNLDFLYEGPINCRGLDINTSYYKTFENNKWYLNSIDTFSKVSNIGYEDILFANKVLVVREGKYLYIKDFNGKNLTEKKIELYVDDMKPCEIYRGGGYCENPGFGGYFNNDKSILNMYILKSKECIRYSDNPDKDCFYKYEFSLGNNLLTQIQ